MMERSKSWYKQGEALLGELSKTQLPGEITALWYLGQSGFAVKSGGLLVFFDPVFADICREDGTSRRCYPAPFPPEAAAGTGAAWVFCTHDHWDHLQPETVVPMTRACPELKLVVPAPWVEMTVSMGVPKGQIVAAREEVPIRLPEGCVCTPIAAAHEEYQRDEQGDHRALCYLFRTAGGTSIFHAGDTVVMPELTGRLQRERGIDAALLPINGADGKRRSRGIVGNMNSREAAYFAEDIGADLVIPCHYDMMQGNCEDPLHFAKYMQVLCPGKKFHMLSLGERFLLTGASPADGRKE